MTRDNDPHRTIIGRIRSLLHPKVVDICYQLARKLPPTVRQTLKPMYRRLWYGGGCRRLTRLASANPQFSPSFARYRVVCFPVIDWELRVQRPQHLLARIAARDCPILYLRNDFKRGKEAVLEPLIPPRVLGLRLPGPASLNIYGDPPSPLLVDTWMNALTPFAEDREGLPTIAIVQWPFWTSLAVAARQRWGWPIIYDCLDFHRAFQATRPETIALEQMLISSSDTLIVTSRDLELTFSPVVGRCVPLHNAADFEHFALHTLIQSQKRQFAQPCVGYIGAMAESFDVELVTAAALTYPKWRFELIGLNSGVNTRHLARLPNVKLLGEIPFDDLPAFLHRFGVAIIPFKVNRLTRAVDPVKVYEYMAAGKPTVATYLPELERFKDLVYLAPDRETFIRLIGVAMAENSADRDLARVNVARANDWSHRAEILDREIRRLIPACDAGPESPVRPGA